MKGESQCASTRPARGSGNCVCGLIHSDRGECITHCISVRQLKAVFRHASDAAPQTVRDAVQDEAAFTGPSRDEGPVSLIVSRQKADGAGMELPLPTPRSTGVRRPPVDPSRVHSFVAGCSGYCWDGQWGWTGNVCRCEMLT